MLVDFFVLLNSFLSKLKFGLNFFVDGVQIMIDLSETESLTSDNEKDDEEDEEEDIHIDYVHNVEKVLCEESFKGKKPMFVQTVKAVKQLLYQKGDKNSKIINTHKIVIKDVRDVSYGMEADIEISKGRLKGLAMVKVWGPSKSSTKKNWCTIIVTKYPHSESKYVMLLAKKVMKPLLDAYLKGEGWKTLITKCNSPNKDRSHCEICDKSFGAGYIKTHIIKMHKPTCNICDKIFECLSDLIKHKTETHSKAAIEIIKEVTEPKASKTDSNAAFNHENIFNCKQCNIQFKTNMECLEHNEKLHIQDNWPDSGSKRDMSLIKTSSISEPKKKKVASEIEMKERSDNMDRKILEKRKKEEMDEILERKSLEEKKRQLEINEELENKKKSKQKKIEENYAKIPCKRTSMSSNIK